jgi:hypothetical protein
VGDFQLVDVMDVLHPDDAHIPSYAHSSNHLDYALISHDLLSTVSGASLNHYHDFYPSDHRPIFVGFHTFLFGHLPTLSTSRTRYVHSNYVSVSKFVKLAYSHLQDTGTFNILDSFCTDILTLPPAELHHIANSIDDQISRELLSAERKCKQPLREPCSEELHFASLQVKYWRLKLAVHHNNYDATASLEAVDALFPKDLKIVPNFTLTNQQSLNRAKSNLTAKRNKANEPRHSFLQELKEWIALLKTPADTDPAAALKCINKQLRQSTKFRHIRHTLKPSHQAPLTKVHVTTLESTLNPETGLTEERTHVQVMGTRQELETRILARNKQDFTQAEGTPFTEEPLQSLTADNALAFLGPDDTPIQLPPGTFWRRQAS